MQTLKYGFEKPTFIWFLVAIVYSVLFWTLFRHYPMSEAEQAIYQIVDQFSQSTFPPKIQLMRELPDWGHLAFYALYGRIFNAVAGDIAQLRMVSLAFILLALLMFVRLGYHFTYRNRLSPIWISLATLVLAASPYMWMSAGSLHYAGMLLLVVFLAVYFFEKDSVQLAAVFLSFGVLIDWHALLLAVAFVVTKITGERSRLLRPERFVAFLLPFAIGALPLLAWNGIVPEGQMREWWTTFQERAPVVRLDSLFYAMALIPIYSLFYSWSWAIRARSRALVIGVVWAAVLIPVYFLFPIRFDGWAEMLGRSDVPLGLVDQGALLVTGPYKNLLLFVPWLAGAFLFMQLLLMDLLDRSRWLRCFIVLFFVTRPFVAGAGDAHFLLVVPFIMLLSLSEALVGEEGKLA